MGRKPNTITPEEKDPSTHLLRERRQAEKRVKALADKATPESRLNDYLIAYGARLMEIDRRHPLGDPERAAWIEAHRRNGLKRFKEIFREALNA